MFQGVAAARIRSLVKAARKNAPSIIFIGGWGGWVSGWAGGRAGGTACRRAGLLPLASVLACRCQYAPRAPQTTRAYALTHTHTTHAPSLSPPLARSDEVDAIGKARTEGGGDSGTAEREAGLLQLLTEMDGFYQDDQARG